MPCPNYPTIRLAMFPRLKVAKKLREFEPKAIHIANVDREFNLCVTNADGLFITNNFLHCS